LTRTASVTVLHTGVANAVRTVEAILAGRIAESVTAGRLANATNALLRTGQASAISRAGAAILEARCARLANPIAAIRRAETVVAGCARRASAIRGACAAILTCWITGAIAAGGYTSTAHAVFRTCGAPAIRLTVTTILTRWIADSVAAGRLTNARQAVLSARDASAVSRAAAAILETRRS
jgi:hypothetical protein